MNQKSFAKNKLEKSQKSSKDELNNSKSSILSRKSNVTEQNLPEIEQVNIEMATSSRKSNIDRKSNKSIRKSGMNTSENFETHNLSDNYKLNKSEYDSSRKSRKSASFERNLSKIELENDSEITALPSRISNISHKSDLLIFRESDTNISVKSKASNKLYNEDIDIDNDCIHSESNADKTSSNNRKSRKSSNSRKSDLSEQNLLVIQENNNVKTPLSQKSLRISNRKSSSNLINSKTSDEDEIIRDELNVYFIAQSPISDLNSNDHNQYGIELQNKNNSRNSIFNEKSSSETESINNHDRRRKSYSRKESKVSLNESNQTKVHLQPETDSIELNKSEYSLNSGKFKNRKLVSSEPFLEYEENSNEISSSSVTTNLDEGILDKSKLNEFSHSQVSIDNNIATDKFSMNKEILDPVENVNISMLSNKSSIGRKSGKIKEDTFNKSEHSFISRKSNNVSAIEPEEITKSLLKSNTDSEYTPNRDKQSTRSSLKSTFSRNSAIDNRTSVAIVEESSDGEPMSSRKSIFNRKSSIDPVMKSSIEGSTGLNDSRESDNYITSRNSVTEHNYLNELNENKSILNRSKKSQKTKVKNSNISNLSSGTLNIDLDNNYNEELIIESGPHENILNFESQSRKSENTTELVRTKVDALTKAVPLKKTVKNKRTIDKDSHTSNQPPSKRQLRHAVENASESLAQDDVTSRTRSNRLREKNTFNGDTDKTANKTLTETHSIVEVIIQNPVKTRGRPKKKEVKTFIENEVVSTIDSTQINLDPTNTSPSFDSNLSKRRGRTKNINMENSDKNNIGMISQENFNEKEDLNKINTIYKKTRGRAKKIPESVVVLDDENLNKSLLNTVYQADQLINKTRSRTKNIKVAENIEYFENNNPTVQKGTRGRAKKITNVENFQIEDSKSIDQNVTRTRSRAKIVEMKVNDSNSLSHPNANESGDLLEVVKKSRGRGPRKKSLENSKASNILELEDANSVSSLTQLTTRGQRKRVLVLEQGNSLITEVENIKNTNDVSKRTRRKNLDINNEEKLIHENSQNVDFKKPSLRIRKNKNTSDLANSEASSIIDTEQEPKVLIEKGRKNKNASQRANSEASSLIDTDQEPKRVTKKGRKNKKEIDSTISETSVIKLVQDGSITRGRRKLQIDINKISDKENEIAVMTSNSKKRIQSENVEEYNEIMVPAKVLRKNILSETNTNTENQGNEPPRTRTRRGKK